MIEEMNKVAKSCRHVHTITDRFSMANTYLIDDDRLIVIDPGSVLNVRLTIEYMHRFLNRTPTDIDLIVLTHLHPDHTAGVELLHLTCHAPVAASSYARELASQWRGQPMPSPSSPTSPTPSTPAAFWSSSGWLPHTPSSGIMSHAMDYLSPNFEQQMQLIDLWLDDVAGLPFHPDWRVIASPGYTLDSLCLYNPFSYELLCGDMMTTLDGGTVTIRNGVNRRLLTETIQTLRNLKMYYLYPGHGRPILSYQPLRNLRIE
jgi:glyoxylase-like metal-dependent hydrolase (beta-lactamase superfamily II)